MKPDVVTTNPKRKNRPKMLLKDHEAKDLLTHEFDPNTSPTTKSIDAEDPFHQETSTDNILARGFRRWLEESQALVAPPSTSTSTSTSGIQSLLIQPADVERDDDNADQSKRSDRVQRVPRTKQSVTVHSSDAFDYTSESLVEPTEEELASMNYDDWAYFLHDHDEQRTVEHACFYARAYNEDTFLSDILPPNPETSTQSITNEHRYGDFHVSTTPAAQISDCRPAKPSEIFRRWRRNQSQS